MNILFVKVDSMAFTMASRNGWHVHYRSIDGYACMLKWRAEKRYVV